MAASQEPLQAARSVFGESRARRTRTLLYALGILVAALLVWRIATVLNREAYPVQYWGFQLINGLVLGGVYALVALGYTMVYGILLMINFAHGEVMMMGGFSGFFMLQLVISWDDGGPLASTAAVARVMLAGMAGSILVGFLLERVAYRPLRQAPRLIPLISAIGASFFLQYAALLILGVTPAIIANRRLLTAEGPWARPTSMSPIRAPSSLSWRPC